MCPELTPVRVSVGIAGLRGTCRDTDIPSVTVKRALGIPVLAIALAWTLAGCGGQPFSETQTQKPNRPTPSASPNMSSRARLLAAVGRAAAAKSARLSLDMKMTSAQANVEFTGSGVIDFARGQSMLRLVQHGGGNVVPPLEVRVVGRTAYVGHDGAWTSVPLDARSLSNGVPDPTS